jgi:hypothetical protein
MPNSKGSHVLKGAGCSPRYPVFTIMKLRSETLALLVLIAPAAVAQHTRSGQSGAPVANIPQQAFAMTTPQGKAEIPYEVSQDWLHPLPGVTRAIILLHGKGRNVEGNYESLERAAKQAGAGATALLITPQFLNDEDAGEHGLPAAVLRWRHDAWQGGEPAQGPLPLSAYDVLDAMIDHLADRSLFPHLATIVVAGHSAGGQAVQRYAVVGKAASVAAAQGIHVRFVIANPSSYLYFSGDRPESKSAPFTFALHHGLACGDFDRWKYGIHDPPPYVKKVAAGGWQPLEDAYAKGDVIYLLGTDDTDPHHPELDISCAGEAEGSSRFLRGQAYFAYLHARHAAEWRQRMWFVPGVAHSEPKMFESSCGVAALFDTAPCEDH